MTAQASPPRLLAWLPDAAVALVLALLPLVLTPYTYDLVVKIAIYAIFALSLELLVGMTGLVSLGHAAFLGIGAYVTALAAAQGTGPAIGWVLLLAVGAA